MKTWQEPPTKIEVRREIEHFLALLREGKLELAQASVGHTFQDWDTQIWSLWQDTYLIYLEELDEEVEDDSFEGKLWLQDLAWLQDIGIEESLHWDTATDRVSAQGEHFFVNLNYKGVALDVSANFSVTQQAGSFCVMRESIQAA